MPIFTAAIALFCASCAPAPLPDPVPLLAPAACRATDGDSVRCGDERLRLLAIDAPELPGHCRTGRECAPGDPVTATESLRDALARGPLTVRRFGKDRYGRTLAQVFASGVDLSCHQLRTGNAIYKRRWDNKEAVRRSCPDAAGAREQTKGR